MSWRLEVPDKHYRNGDSRHLQHVRRSDGSISSFRRWAGGPGRGAGSLRARQRVRGNGTEVSWEGKAAWQNPGVISWPLTPAGALGGHGDRMTGATSAALYNSESWLGGLDTLPPGGREAPVRWTSSATEECERAMESVLQAQSQMLHIRRCV